MIVNDTKSLEHKLRYKKNLNPQTAAQLAKELEAEFLIILTAVDQVAINYGRPDVRWLSRLTCQQAREYIAQGHFAPGSMLPKVEAAVSFAESGSGRAALITRLVRAREGILGLTGTRICR